MKKVVTGAIFAAVAATAPAQAAVNGTVAVTVLQNVTSVCGTLLGSVGNTPSLVLGEAGGVFQGTLGVAFYCNSRYGMDLQLKSEKSGMKEADENGVNAIDYTLDLNLNDGTSISMNTAGSVDASDTVNVTDADLLVDGVGLGGSLTLTTDGSAPVYSGIYSDTITLSITAGGSFGAN